MAVINPHRWSDEARAILVEAVVSGNDIVRIRGQQGTHLLVGERRFLEPGDDVRKKALWSAALGELEFAGSIAPVTLERSCYRVTRSGIDQYSKLDRTGPN